ncbi:hypothetical protein MKW94_002913 [Papaver nudicaule]|uniref:Lachrymatory factor synthase n=1 Tax=Papaver nudicaule TaxID=74823 RepID=A0AA41UYP5_PAPNU|nr:hypothetical protein [Papaver nudicaule]
MAHEKEEEKWKGKACTTLKDLTAEELWPLFEDFLSIHKWLPGVDACTLVEGVSGEPGCVRYCTGTAVPTDGSDDTLTSWVKEKLLLIDPVERCISYEVIEGNVGFESYIATIKVLSDSSEDAQENGDDHKGSTVEWSYVVNPVPGWKSEDLASYIDSILQTMAKRMEEALLQTKIIVLDN